MNKGERLCVCKCTRNTSLTFDNFVEPASVGETTVNGNSPSGSKQKSKPKSKNKSSGKNFTSDAILSCPACLTTLCIDCQR